MFGLVVVCMQVFLICVPYWKRKFDNLNNRIMDSNPHKHRCVSAFFCVCVILCRS
jgi:hypothetical protein